MDDMRKALTRQLQMRAVSVLKDRAGLANLLHEASAKADSNKSRLQGLWNSLKVMVRMLKSWVSGRYRHVPWKTVVAAVGAIIYFVNPFDLIPDFLLIGLADDALLIGWVLASVKADLNKFLLWERTIAIHAEKVE